MSLMLGILSFFTVTIIVIGCLSTLASIWIFGINRNTDADPETFVKHNSVCKTAVICLMALGWLLGDPANMTGFANGIKTAGVFWFGFGVAYMILIIYCLVTEADKKMLTGIMKFGSGNLLFGIIISTVGWLLWG